MDIKIFKALRYINSLCDIPYTKRCQSILALNLFSATSHFALSDILLARGDRVRSVSPGGYVRAYLRSSDNIRRTHTDSTESTSSADGYRRNNRYNITGYTY